VKTQNEAPGVGEDTPSDGAGANHHSPCNISGVTRRKKTDSAGRCQIQRPAKPQRLVIPDLIRNPESFSPAQRAAKFD
jgi:hypothetical protein